MGRMDTSKERWLVISSNFALIQVQAITVAFLASAFAMVLSWIPKGRVRLLWFFFCCLYFSTVSVFLFSPQGFFFFSFVAFWILICELLEECIFSWNIFVKFAESHLLILQTKDFRMGQRDQNNHSNNFGLLCDEFIAFLLFTSEKIFRFFYCPSV